MSYIKFSPRAHSRYCPKKVLATNNKAQVILCLDNKTKELVVLKVILKKVTDEVNITKMMSKKRNSITLLDIIEEDEAQVMVMKYAKHGTLLDYIRNRECDLPLSIKLFVPILQIVSEMHKAHYAHRDLKLENILIEGDSTILIDYEFAIKVTQKLTVSSCGSPHYASPELVKGGSYNLFMSDIYSLGIILYAIITRKLPFTSPDPTTLFSLIMSQDVPFPDEFNPKVKKIIQLMTHKIPAMRPELYVVTRVLCSVYLDEVIRLHGNSFSMLKLYLNP